MSPGLRVLVVQPYTRPPGGGQAVCAWVLQALTHEHEVTLLTLSAPDFAEIDRVVGTSLASAPPRVEVVARAAVAALDLLPLPLDLLRMHLLLGRARAIGGSYDVVISTNNEASLGRRGIQYVHFPWAYQPRPPVELRWFHRLPGVLPLYYALAGRLSAFDPVAMRANLTLVNSDWTGERFRSWHGGTTLTVPPPASGNYPSVAWEDREEALIAIGRISPEKELEKVLSIADALRGQRPGLRLNLVGGGDRRHGRYLERIRAEVERRRDWVTLEEVVDRDRLAQRIAGCRYGIHGMRDEHFGMAVVEMLRGGCIPFAPDSGGPREILGDPRLLYESPDDAVQKLLRVMESPAEQQSLRAHLRPRADLYTPERFQDSMRRLVREWPDQAATPKGSD